VAFGLAFIRYLLGALQAARPDRELPAGNTVS
jgi:hypothetical protein